MVLGQSLHCKSALVATVLVVKGGHISLGGENGAQQQQKGTMDNSCS